MTNPTIANLFTCPACGHQDAAPPGPPPAASILRCPSCQTRIAFGQAMPRVTVTPDETDGRFVMLIFETRDLDVTRKQTIRVDRAYGLSIWNNVRSICQ